MRISRRVTTSLVFMGLLLGVVLLTGAESVTRGPYLQIATPTSLIVKWRTDTSTDARVRFGPDPASLIWSADQSTSGTNHEVQLTGLTPDTKYYYSIGTSGTTLAGGDAGHFFITPPLTGISRPTRVWVLGDSGDASAGAVAVRNAYQTFTGSRYTDALLMLGDNAYNDGTDAEYQNAVFNMYPAQLRQTVLWPTLGNHDGRTANSSTQAGPYYDIFTLPKQGEAGGMASGTEAYYSFNVANIHFICLESYETNRSTNGPMLTWLRNDLAANTQPWVIAYWHHPPYSKGAHDSDNDIEMIQMRENALPILEDFGVDLVLTGHSHSYERSFLIDGHYDTAATFSEAMKKDGGNGRANGAGAYTKPDSTAVPHAGAVYAVAGSSSKTDSGPLNHPAMFISLVSLGSMVLDVNGNTLDGTFLDSTGATRDYFTIVKASGGAPPAAPTGLSATAPSSSAVQLAWSDASTTETAFRIERAPGGSGSFVEIGAVTANVTTYTDGTVAAATAYRYRVRAVATGAGFSEYSNEAGVTTLAAPPGQVLKAITFEAGTLTHAVSGADSVSGAVTLESATPLKANYAARVAGGNAYLQEQFPATSDFYLSFYVRLAALPAADVRLVLVSNAGTTVGTVLVRPTGRLRLRVNTTTVGAESAPLTPGGLYRIGLRQRAGTGASAVLEGFLANGDAAFGAPFATTTTGTWTSNADRLRLGATAAAAIDAVVDEVRLDAAAMPGPSPVGPPVPPAAPTGLSATASSSSAVQLAWSDASTSETAFRIERAPGGSGSFVEIGAVAANATTYGDGTVAAATAYRYRVRAASAEGFSDYSNLASVTTPDAPSPPAAPTGLSATAPSSSAVQLAWSDASTTETAFRIERAPGGSGSFVEIGAVTANVTTYTDGTVAAATAYRYRVRAVATGAGFSEYSNEAGVTTLAAPPGQVLKAITFEAGTLTHAVSGADSVSGAVTLESATPLKANYAARVAGGNAYLQEQFPATSDFYLSFYVRLAALPAADVRLVLVSNAGTTVGTVLVRPTGRLRLRVNTTTVGAESAPLTPGGLYRIGLRQRAGTGASAVLEGFLANGDAAFGAPFATTTTGTWTSNADRLRLGATAAAAIDAVVDEVRLDAAAMPGPSPVGPPVPPAAPTGLSATASSSSAVQLAWSDASTSETAFRIERAPGGSGSFVEIGAVAANATTYGDGTVAAATAYRYRVRAASAEGFSDYSNLASVTTPDAPSPPAAPTGLSATAPSSSAVQLAWSDASTTETAFRIERAPGGSGSFVEIGAVTANVTTYTDGTVAAATAYRYRVRAAATGAGFSDYSNEAGVTTPAAPPGQVLKAITFEAGTLTHAVSGADSVSGAVTLESATPLKGLYAARVSTGSAYLEEKFGATSDLYASFYVRVEALPASDVRLLLVSNGGVTVGNMILRSTGRLRLRIDNGTVGVDSAPLVVGQLYRIGIHQRAGTGATAVLEAFLASGDASFGSPFAVTTTGNWSTLADRLRIGATTSTAASLVIDEARLDGIAMPGPSQ